MRYEIKAGEAIHWLPEKNGYPVIVKAEIDLEVIEELGERWVRVLHPRDHGKTMICIINQSPEEKTLKADMQTYLVGAGSVLPITEHSADLCADPALLAEAVERIGQARLLLDTGAVCMSETFDYQPATILHILSELDAALAKLENRHDS